MPGPDASPVVARPGVARPGSARARRARRALIALIGITLVAVAGTVGWSVMRPEPVAEITERLGPARCAPGERSGGAQAEEIAPAGGPRVRVRTPANYDPQRAQGLLVLYPPAGHGARASERFYGLTPQATRQGWIVAYPAAIGLSASTIVAQARVTQAVAERWCIDPDRVVHAGHSDGASLALGIPLRAPEQAPRPVAIIASASGIRGEDLSRETCPAPARVSIVHSPADRHFPGYGPALANWWAACWRCGGRLPVDIVQAAAPQACVDLGPCEAGGAVRYCQAIEPHEAWPAVADRLLRERLAQ